MSMAVDGPRNLSRASWAQYINKAGRHELRPRSLQHDRERDPGQPHGPLPVTIQSASVAESHIKEGTLRPLAVAGTKRIAAFPNVPAIAETLPSIDLQGWFMVLAPANAPADIVQKLSSEIAGALKSPEVQERAPALGFDVGMW